MSFLYINDPQKREEIVTAYLTKKKNGIFQEEKPNTQEQDDFDEIAYNKNNKSKELYLANKCKIVRHYKNIEIPAEGKHDMNHIIKFHIGKGIQFLPGDINSLKIKLDYLLAEYQAGNTSATSSEIVAITDELLRRKVISKGKYNSINTYIQK